ncbi:uncharacterized protein LY89DRAFT_377817 [Mollisia scopiformis]|uniref:Uncharacterized protein n=1 Tax=Mollisia scopiformis TaxID=149040 RepID=A0A194XN45_MOLSC|nr:uncharacterized protein LY89DRAFT_377817 [Mollisia scopiformis]KUJ21556.1 hypothetical protein LY89DRAFT_377817 [Mollisia scopiformis]
MLHVMPISFGFFGVLGGFIAFAMFSCVEGEGNEFPAWTRGPEIQLSHLTHQRSRPFRSLHMDQPQ